MVFPWHVTIIREYFFLMLRGNPLKSGTLMTEKLKNSKEVIAYIA
ncbi:RNA chaperone ProQ, partial [Vibrio parahaemolyticus]